MAKKAVRKKTARKRPSRRPSIKFLDSIRNDARDRLLLQRSAECNMYLEAKTLRRGQAIELPDSRIGLEIDTVMVFADDEPLSNWGHPCRYMLYNAENGHLYRTVEALFPPYMTKTPRTYKAFHEPVVYAKPSVLWRVKEFPTLSLVEKSNWFAVLFSGGSNNRHTNDLEFLYRSLRNDYKVPANQIYVLNYDGTINYSGAPQPAVAWPGDGTSYTMPVNSAGTKSELNAVLDDLKTRLKPESNLLIHTNNHGGRSGNESTLIMHSGPNYGETEFGAKLAELPQFNCLMVMMEQCFAGGFNSPIIANSTARHTSVASAAIATNTSIGGPDFDPFARDWIAAMHRFMPDGGALASNPDTNGDGAISAIEAFNYADSVHHPHDTPVYSQSAFGAGHCTLGKKPPYFILPELTQLVDRYWLDPGPLREAFTRLERIRPELERLAAPEIERSAEVRREIEERVRRALG